MYFKRKQFLHFKNGFSGEHSFNDAKSTYILTATIEQIIQPKPFYTPLCLCLCSLFLVSSSFFYYQKPFLFYLASLYFLYLQLSDLFEKIFRLDYFFLRFLCSFMYASSTCKNMF